MNTVQAPVAPQELVWFKSSYSGAEGGQCVEVADAPEAVLVRDSKNTSGPVLRIAPEAWTRFVRQPD